MGRELRKTIENGVELWAVHETVSEVEDAITPGFKTKAELIEHMVAHGTDWDGPWPRPAADDFVNRTGWAPSFIVGPEGLKKGYERTGWDKVK
jgi:hypothetical protein